MNYELNVNNKQYNENGAIEYITTNNQCLDLYFNLNRNYNLNNLKDKINICLNTNNPKIIADLFVLVFQTRNCRGGKGEKILFYNMLLILYNSYPKTIIKLLKLIPHYGYYKDYIKLLNIIIDNELSYKLLEQEIINIIINQINKDINEIKKSKDENRTPIISLVGKYAPRPNKHFKIIAKHIYNIMFPFDKKAEEKYRKILSLLNKTLNITEVYMCANKYSEINFSNVPSICLNKCRKAFLNEKLNIKPLINELYTGNRYIENIDRITCRQNLINNINNGHIQGKQLMPHEIINKILFNYYNQLSESEISLLNTQWIKIKENVIKNNKNSDINIGNLVALVDVSESMRGLPMGVAIAMGILVSEINNTAFKDIIITFETEPSWVNLKNLNDIYKKTLKVSQASWGGSTNLIKAIKMILEIAINNKLSNDEIPDLIIFSDMQFDCAHDNTNFKSTYDSLKELFYNTGISISGKPYKIPKIIFWNLRAGTGVPIQLNINEPSELNVQLLSGFSPSMLKILLEGGKIENNKPITPDETFNNIINDDIYNIIREVLTESNENILNDYQFITI